MTKYAIVVMSQPCDDHPDGQGRMLHAMHAARELRATGADVRVWFHGIGVTWLTAFDQQPDRFTQVYRPLFDEIRDLIAGACAFCAATRFGAEPSARKLGIPMLGSSSDHHTIAPLLAQGFEVVTF